MNEIGNLHFGASIKLVPAQARFSEELFNLVDENRDHLRKWLPWVDSTRDIGDSKNFLRSAVLQDQMGNGRQYLIFLPQGLAGICGIHWINRHSLSTSIGYWLAEKFQGNGVMFAAIQQLLAEIFKERELHRVEISAALENHRSRNLAIKLGFKEEGIRRDFEFLHGSFLDHMAYSLLENEWPHKP